MDNMIDKMSTPLESRLRLGGRPPRRAHSLSPRQRRGEMVAAIIGLLWLSADMTGVAGIGEQLPTEFSQLTRSDPPPGVPPDPVRTRIACTHTRPDSVSA